ncbi:MAG: uroporphyrinogen-III synthase [Sphingomonadales bacterium]|nr:uroporphyrinogen-III synthase [Sphingomonadales bacterium]
MGFDPAVLPLFHVQPLPWQVPADMPYDALLITSANAVHLGGARLAQLYKLPVYAVGAKSAQCAADAGLTVAATGTQDAEAIVAKAAADGVSRLLWLRGKKASDFDIPSCITINSHIVYDAARIEPPIDFASQVRSANVILLHSPQAARYFAECCERSGIEKSAITIAALSPNIADSAGEGWAKTIIAPRPDDALLLNMIASGFTSGASSP